MKGPVLVEPGAACRRSRHKQRIAHENADFPQRIRYYFRIADHPDIDSTQQRFRGLIVAIIPKTRSMRDLGC